MKIIGICGQPASGKDTAADFFVARGFTHISLGNLLREEMKKANLPMDRASMSQFAADAKATRGMGYLADSAINRISNRSIISGIRGTTEVDIFRRKFGLDFILLCVEAPLRIRYERSRRRNRPGDDVSFEEFQAIENHERSAASGAQEVDKVIAMANRIIDNTGSVEELNAKLSALAD